jgi:hypothetical protein
MKNPQQVEFAQALLGKARQIPGVDLAALTDHLPLEGRSNGYIKVRGQPSTPMNGPLVETHSVSPDAPPRLIRRAVTNALEEASRTPSADAPALPTTDP